MENSSFFTILINLILLAYIQSIPVPENSNPEFCNTNGNYAYDLDTNYFYDYKTKTLLWINDVSNSSKTSVELNAEVAIRRLKDCTYQLRLQNVKLNGESIDNNANDLINNLEAYASFFRLNSNGELDSLVQFDSSENNWSRNIKRGIISSFQAKNPASLSSFSEDDTIRSSLVYENDILGRCRTIYSLKKKDEKSESSFKLNKRKALHSCTLNQTVKSSSVQFSSYRSLPEFYHGRLFVEDYECDINVENNVITKVDCEEKSTYKIGSKGDKGAQAVVKSELKLKTKSNLINKMSLGAESLQTSDIVFDFSDSSYIDNDLNGFDIESYLNDLCKNLNEDGLSNQHSNGFRAIVKLLKSKSKDEIVKLYDNSKKICEIAGLTFSEALLFVNTENSFDVVLNLLDNDAYSNQLYITEYPILTALTRVQNPSVNLISKLEKYINSKDKKFAYLRKLYLVYSSIIHTYCSKNQCSDDELNKWSSLFSDNLGSDCSDSSNKDLVTSSLKAIGNIGSLKNFDVLHKCASNKDNSLEVRLNAIESFKKFNCQNYMTQLTNILRDLNEDSEIRINSFLVLAKCIQTEEFSKASETLLTPFFEKEEDIQVLTFIADYAKEHGLTSLLNPLLANQKVKERFSVNFKELSWNNYRYRYSFMRDAAYELETSVIYAPKSFIPRSIKLNVTFHMFGIKVNFFDATLRVQGLTDVLKAVVIDKMTSEEYLKKIVEKPEELIDLLKDLADKLKFEIESPSLSLSIRRYGAHVYYAELNDIKKLQSLAEFLRNPKDKILYTQTNTIKNYFLIDSRVRHPLANGLEFNSFLDLSAGLFISKQSSKTDSTPEGIKEFLIKNFYSLSATLNKRLEILVDSNNKLSIRKLSNVNARVNLNIEGNKKNNVATYKIKLPKSDSKTLLLVDGRFFKLISSAKSDYQEINDFSVDKFEYSDCTSSKFHSSMGFDLCLSIKRPAVGGIKEVVKTLDLSNTFKPFENDDDDDDDDDEDDDNDDGDHNDHDGHNHNYYKRPKLALSGPYHYEVSLLNPDKIDKVLLQFERESNDESYDLKGTLKTETNGYVQDRLEMHYSRSRSDLNIGLERKLELELKVPSTNEIRFRLLGELAYRKSELLNLHFNLENKILKELHVELNVKREKKANDIIGEYKLEALFDSQIRSPKQFRLLIDVKPEGKNIKSNIIIEKTDESTNQENLKLLDGILTLIHSDSQNDIDYDVDLQLESFTKNKLHIYGHVGASIFQSSIDLSLESSRLFNSLPLNIKAGHLFDGSSKSKSYVELAVKIPETSIDYGLKFLFKVEVPKLKLNYVEAQIKAPKFGDAPFSIYVGRNSDSDDLNKYEFIMGIQNINMDLSERKSGLANALVKVDNDKILKSLALQLTRTSDENNKQINYELVINKNSNLMAKLSANLNGSLRELREKLNKNGDLDKQELSASIKAKLLEYTGSVSSKLSLSSSSQKKDFSFDFETDNLFKILLKISSVKVKFQTEGSKINAQYEIVRLGDLRSVSLKATNAQIRSTSSNNKEFDFAYEKNLANGQSFKKNGIAKYKFDDFKNFNINFDVDGSFNFMIDASNSKKSDLSLGEHSINLILSHLDHQPFSRQLKIKLNNQTDSSANKKRVQFDLLLREGTPYNLDDLDDLTYMFDLKTNNELVKENEKTKLLDGDNSLTVKVKAINLDINLSSNRDSNKNEIKNDINGKIKFPAMLSDSGKINYFKLDAKYNKKINDKTTTLISNFETDNKLVGKFVQNAKLEFNRQVNQVNNLADTNAKLSYNNLSSDKNKNINIKFETDCITGNCKIDRINIKQDLIKEWKSFLASDTILDLSEIKYSREFNRIKEENIYLLDFHVSLDLSNKKLIDLTTTIKRADENDDSDYPLLYLLTSAQSDIYFEKRKYELSHKKFSSKNGLFMIGLERGNSVKLSTKLNYNRKIDKETNKLINGEYIWQTTTGLKSNKICTLKIESKDNYYNTLNCKLNHETLPVEINYGYALKVNDIKSFLFGKRSIELNLNVPGRTLRFDYNGHYSTPFDKYDDDDDENNEREFNGTFRYYWDYSKDQSKLLTINLKRDNYALGESKTSVNFIVNGPTLNKVNFELKRSRRINQTRFNAQIGYELKNGKTNNLDINAIFYSDMNTNKFSFENNLDRPAFNTLYKSKYNKYNGRLLESKLRIGKLLSINLDKDENDIKNRKISLELSNPDESNYELVSEKNALQSNGIYFVETLLKDKSGNELSRLSSSFDSYKNKFTVIFNAIKTKQIYKLNIELFNETIALANLMKNDKIELGKAFVELDKSDDFNNLIISLKWNRVWKQLKEDLLGGLEQSNLKENSNYNSYFGDLYAVLAEDLKPTIENIREIRKSVRGDISKLAFILSDFYLNAVPELKENIREKFSSLISSDDDNNSIDNLPLYKRLFIKYNKLAQKLTDLSLFIRRNISKRLSKYVPRLPVLSYNSDDIKDSSFENNLLVKRPTLFADNLYQFYAEQRNYVRNVGQRILSGKGNLLRGIGGLSIKSLINKYKYRSLSDYTILGHVYNKRNIISFNGQSKILKIRCKYLLTHELRRNEFSVILNNFEITNSLLTISASKHLFDISYDKAYVDNTQVSLPYKLVIDNNRKITITKTFSGVCIKVNKDLKVCCNEDSKSCTIGLTRWFTGKVNGLLGSSNLVAKNFEEDYWYADNKCKVTNSQLKKPNEEAVKTCYSIFGNHRKAFFRSSFGAIKPNGWRSICEHVLSNDPKSKCALMKAYAYHAKIKRVEVDEPNECYTCQLNDSKFNINEKVPKELASNSFKNGTDYVFLILPCEKKYSLESLSKIAKKFQNKNNRHYIIKVDEETSIHQSSTSEILNTDIQKASNVLGEENTNKIAKNNLYEGLYLAIHLFSQRLAQNRRLIIVSCGNCLPYSSIEAIKITKLLNQRNIIVSSWGSYDMKDLNRDSESETNEIPIGYNDDKVFLYNAEDNQIEVDDTDGYKIEHKGDLCQRLAVKTEGNVFDINYIKETDKFQKIFKRLEETKVTYKNVLGRCERIDTPYGDLDDFTIKRTKLN